MVNNLDIQQAANSGHYESVVGELRKMRRGDVITVYNQSACNTSAEIDIGVIEDQLRIRLREEFKRLYHSKVYTPKQTNGQWRLEVQRI